MKLLGKRWFMKRTRRTSDHADAPAKALEGDGECEEGEGSRLPDNKKAFVMMEMDACRQRRGRRRPLGRGLLSSRVTQQEQGLGCGSESKSLLDSTDSTSWTDEAPWRVEYILSNRPPCESDWWEEEQSSSFESDEGEVSSDSLDRTCSETTNETQSSSITRRKCFRNVGLETYQLVNQAWKQVPNHQRPTAEEGAMEATSTPPPKVTASSSVPSASARRDLVKVLASNRNYELKQRVGLHHLVSMYNDLWTEDWSDE